MKKFILLLTILNFGFSEEYIPRFPEDVTMSKEDIIVANTILGEARGEGYYGMSIVADVIYERVKLKRWKNAAAACLAENQFSASNYKHGRSDRRWFEALALAKKVNRGEDIIRMFKFTQFRAWKISEVPPYAINIKYYKNHVFFNEKRDFNS